MCIYFVYNQAPAPATKHKSTNPKNAAEKNASLKPNRVVVAPVSRMPGFGMRTIAVPASSELEVRDVDVWFEFIGRIGATLIMLGIDSNLIVDEREDSAVMEIDEVSVLSELASCVGSSVSPSDVAVGVDVVKKDTQELVRQLL